MVTIFQNTFQLKGKRILIYRLTTIPNFKESDGNGAMSQNPKKMGDKLKA